MPKYHRVLVKYPLPNSEKWSNFHWCDIEKIANDIVIKTAPVGTAMPIEAKFTQPFSEAVKKLLVYDFEQTDPYCVLVFKNKVMYQFNFQKSISTFTLGRPWSFESNKFDDKINTLQASTVFKDTDYNDYKTLQSVSNLRDNLNSQYSDWKKLQKKKVAVIKTDNSTTTNDIRGPDAIKEDRLIDNDNNIDVQRAILESCKDEITNNNINTLQPTNYLGFFATPRNIDYSTLILKLLGVAASTYALFIIGTSPWIGTGLIVVGALCLCAGMIGNPYCTKLSNLFNCAR